MSGPTLDLELSELLRRTQRLYVGRRRMQGASDELLRQEIVANGIQSIEPDADSIGVSMAGSEWPGPLDPRALHGLTARFVELVEPHTEADPVGLLVQSLVGFGSVIGRGAHVRVEDDQHYGNLYALLLGATARGRKGTSWRRTEHLLGRIDPHWQKDCLLTGGLSSGEGLTWAVRDPDEERREAGVRDKRLLVFEGEFASVQKVLAREGNTLSAVLRSLWDGGSACIKTKNNPCRTSGAHISLIAHVTRDEFLRRLDPSELAGGLMNRFLFVAVRRSKILPDGGHPLRVEIEALAEEFGAAAAFGREDRELRFDDEAHELWLRVYGVLSTEHDGRYGAATARAEAQTRRISMLYAVLDRSPLIRVQHLVAALALWDYCDRSARHVFGSQQGDLVADDILQCLRDDGGWVARGNIVDYLGRHVSGARLQLRLNALLATGLLDRREEATGGRPRELFIASKARKASILDLCSLSSRAGRRANGSEGLEHEECNPSSPYVVTPSGESHDNGTRVG